MKWLEKQIDGKIIYFLETDNSLNPRIIIRELPNGKYVLEDKLLGIQKKAANFERLTCNYFSEIFARSIELKFLQDNVKDITWGDYGDEDASYSKEIHRYLISNFSRRKKNRNRLIELDDGSFLFTWNFQGTYIEVPLSDKKDRDELDKLIKNLHSVFVIKEREINYSANLFKEA